MPGLPLQHKGDKPFRAPHILLIPLAQLRLEDVLFYMDTVTHAKQRTSHNDEQTQPVCQTDGKLTERWTDFAQKDGTLY